MAKTIPCRTLTHFLTYVPGDVIGLPEEEFNRYVAAKPPLVERVLTKAEREAAEKQAAAEAEEAAKKAADEAKAKADAEAKAKDGKSEKKSSKKK